MLALAFMAFAGGVVLMVAGVTGSSVASAAKGHPDHAKNVTPEGSAGTAGGGGTATAAATGKLGSLTAAGVATGAPSKQHSTNVHMALWMLGAFGVVAGFHLGGFRLAFDVGMGR